MENKQNDNEFLNYIEKLKKDQEKEEDLRIIDIIMELRYQFANDKKKFIKNYLILILEKEEYELNNKTIDDFVDCIIGRRKK